MTFYQVTAPCVVHIPTVTAAGPALGTFYKDAVLPDGVPQDKLDHLLANGMIRAVDEPGSEPEAESEAGQDPAQGGQDPAESPPGDGVPTVNSRSSKADLIAYGVANGDGTPEALAELTRDQLLGRYVRQQQ
ncbi:hypothetical protein ACBJ59_10615 [Nonomuraea sp. MTCD27]|uniref:hypothetical protein n=1 Tax=Nonomuraea sp. MTCD27 TaxID=1676747 RepID=UPI0035C1F13D